MQIGQMQTTPLLISAILTFGERAHPRREIVSRLIDEPLFRYDYAGLSKRCQSLAHVLGKLAPGGKVSSLAWNTHRHLELLYAVPSVGATLHTANPRLHDEQIVFTINHAESTVLFFDRNLLAIVERLAPKLDRITTYVMLCDESKHLPGKLGAQCYETLLSEHPSAFVWPSLDENTGAVLCYTSGTTGDPKGVLYSHRAVVLHAMALGQAGAFGFTAFDAVMPCCSLYHATGWGLPYAALMAGSKFVLPADKMDGANLHELIDGEGITFSCGVPTIWTMYLQWLESKSLPIRNLRKLVVAGSAMPRAMAEAFDRAGVSAFQIWGMTETTPLGVAATATPALAARGDAQMRDSLWGRQGRVQFGIELRVVDEAGNELPWDDKIPGQLQVRGPWVVSRYFKAQKDATDEDGWFDTGDVATIDKDGFMRITDRKKDVIKSGGEWISSIDLENVASACPGVRLAAVIAVPHPKWEERPILVIEPQAGVELDKGAILKFMTPLVAKWWLPEVVVFDIIPLTATGKLDKKVLRERYKGLKLS